MGLPGVVIVSRQIDPECQGRHGISKSAENLFVLDDGHRKGRRALVHLDLAAGCSSSRSHGIIGRSAALVEDLKANGPGKAMALPRGGAADDQGRSWVIKKKLLETEPLEGTRTRRSTSIEARSRRRSKSRRSIHMYVVGRPCSSKEADLVDAFSRMGRRHGWRTTRLRRVRGPGRRGAADAKYSNLVIKGNSLPLDWARPRGGPSRRDADRWACRACSRATGACAAAGARRGLWLEAQQGAAGRPKEGAAAAACAMPVMDPNRLGSRPPGAPPGPPRRG